MSNGFTNVKTLPPVTAAGLFVKSTVSGYEIAPITVDDVSGLSQTLLQTWRWTTSTTEAATGGRVGVNQASWADVTQVNLNETTFTGVDWTNILANAKAGDKIVIQDASDASKVGRYTISAPFTDQGTWRSFPVTFVNGSGILPANNVDARVAFTFYGTGGGGGAGSVILTGTGNPSAAIGHEGDFYVNTTTDIMYGPKTGSTWPEAMASGQGPVGPQGPQGNTGNTGAQGPQGNTGSQGPQGTQGPQGIQGPVGPERAELAAIGPQIPSGNANSVANNGWYHTVPGNSNLPVSDYGALMYVNITYAAAGRQTWWQHGTTRTWQRFNNAGVWSAWVEIGLQGPQGIQGPQGATGNTGAQGPQGNTGSQGPQGNTGATGSQGPQGVQGPVGPTRAELAAISPQWYDLNTFQVNGWCHHQAGYSINGPLGGTNGWHVIHCSTLNVGTNCLQTAYEYGGNRTWERRCWNGGWGAWVQTWPLSVGVDSGWTYPQQFGWEMSHYGAPWGPVQCRKLSSGLVIWRGLVATGEQIEGPAWIGYAPVGFRPGIQQMFACHTSAGERRVDIATNGLLQLDSMSPYQGYISLNELAYYAEN